VAGNVEWRTPEEIFAICSEAWGPIGLDAAASHDNVDELDFWTRRAGAGVILAKDTLCPFSGPP